MTEGEKFYALLDSDKKFREKMAKYAHISFWHYCLLMDYDFYMGRKKVLERICRLFQDFEEGKYNIIYLGLPPRTGKSYTCSHYCAWKIGKTPDISIMRNSVSGDLFNVFSLDIKNMISGQTHGGRFSIAFPDIELKTSNISGWRVNSKMGRTTYFGAGVGGNIIGKGANIGIVDDSIKNAEEAMSERGLEKKWAWYTSAHRSRIETPKKEIHIATRWSKRDIPGRLIIAGRFAKKDAAMMVVPAEVIPGTMEPVKKGENGVSFCEQVLTTEELMEEKKYNPPAIYSAEYQQDPTEATGLVFPADELKRFSLEDLPGPPEKIILFGDTADEGTDFLCVPVGYVYTVENDLRVYVVDVIFTQEPMEVTEVRTAEFVDKHVPDIGIIESNNGGRGFARAVNKIITCGVELQWRQTTSNKHSRIMIRSGWIKEHMYFRDDYERGGEYENYIVNVMAYNRAGKVENDDGPDATEGLSQILNVESWGF